MNSQHTATLPHAEELHFETSSFRDRSARVAIQGNRILRLLSPEALDEWTTLSQASFWKNSQAHGTVIQTHRAHELDASVRLLNYSGVLEHQRVDVLTWPWEWTFSMLQDVAIAQLQLMQDSLREGWILKDATPFNFQFVDSRPVLIDTGSVTRLAAGQAWEGYRQFCQMFLFPLMLQAWKNVDFQPWLRGNLEGLSAKQFAGLLSLRDMFRRGALSHVWLHSMLQGSSPQKSVAASLKTEGFNREMIERNVANLLRIVSGLRWKQARSVWSNYNQEAAHVAADRATKERFVRMACQNRPVNTVWDMGCNQGYYSRVAAEYAAHVVAMDSDTLTIDQLYQSLRQEQNSRIHPLLYNVADPAPSLGWRLEERRCLQKRSQPDLILCLALIHHLVISSNLLLSDVVRWLAEHHCDVILEWVDRSDPLVQQLLMNRTDVFSDYSEAGFREVIGRCFDVLREERLPSGHRTLFHLKSRIL